MKFNVMSYNDILRALRGHDFDTVANSLTVEDAYGNVYTRADAIADGFLIDVSQSARELGFCLTVAITASAWAQLVAVPHKKEEEIERLFALLGRVQTELDQMPVTDHRCFVTAVAETGEDEQVEIRITVGPDDKGRSVITIMLGYEDQA